MRNVIIAIIVIIVAIGLYWILATPAGGPDGDAGSGGDAGGGTETESTASQ